MTRRDQHNVDMAMTVQDTIRTKLTAALQPLDLEIIDESRLHAGHNAAAAGGETHFRLRIVSDAFRGKTRLERHRMVQDLLRDELAGPVHALALKTQTAREASGQH